MKLRRLLALTLLLAACGGDAPDAGVVVTDSAGVRIVTHPPPSHEDAPRWRTAAAPTTRIGAVEGTPEQQLYQVRGATRMSDGRIAILNMGTREVRFYAPDGSYMGAFGREGEGPGEFRLPSRLTRLGGDTLVVTGASLDRFSWFDSAGTFLSSRDVDVGRLMAVIPSTHGTHGAEYVPGDRLLADVFEAGLGPEGQVHRMGSGRLSAAVDLSRVDTIFWHLGSEQVGGGGGPAYFGRTTWWAFGGDPVRFYQGDNAAYDIEGHAIDGGLELRIRREGDGRPVHPDDLERWRSRDRARAEERGGDWPQRTARLHANLPEPATMPTHGQLHVDTEGNLWVEEYRTPWEEARRYGVYAPDGALLARAELPDGLHPLELGPDYVIGVRRDALDVEYVEVYHVRSVAWLASDW
ncbi:MAG TPA: hypothetical protein VMK65_01495 [Longimicrobiales bacterium]|nr:hypothetical protein [Longimicrobiales bacterium]